MSAEVATPVARKRAAATAVADSPVARRAVAEKGAAPSTAGPAPAAQEQVYLLCSRLLGGARYWRPRMASRSDVHSAIVKGIPYGSLTFLLSQVQGLDEGDVAKVLGISTRTLRRLAATPEKPMPPDLASKAWLFAETLAKAAGVFGGQEQAERWMSRPALGLDRQRPIDLLQTVQGAELVSDFLTRLEYGVYT